MTVFYIFIIIVVIGVIAFKRKVQNNEKSTWPKPNFNKDKIENLYEEELLYQQKWPFKKRKLMNKYEISFYKTLKESIPELHVFAQVSLSQIIFFHENYKIEEKKYWTNRIDRMSIDYVITNDQFETMVIIELDGPHHEKEYQRKRDRKKDKALMDAGIKVIRIPINNIPTKELIKQKIQECIPNKEIK